MSKKLSKKYYFEPSKFIRDLVHSYINLSKFELKIIDTAAFQRLKDVRQLTCQDVYPCARHTRFEHSLGVLELTKQAIKYLNKNGFITGYNSDKEIIDDQLAFNARIAALLHDIGHCPFSHLGETQFDEKDVKKHLYNLLSNNSKKYNISKDLIDKFRENSDRKVGAVHEQLSCIVILEDFYDILSDLTRNAEENNKKDYCSIETDFELIIRSILGIEYDVSTHALAKDNYPKNAIVRLINSNIFDMDKLDYIMRDSFYTGIGTPGIDTSRLFKNMYFDNCFELVFTSRAVPVLQNMIDSRDGLYMYVYNHHAVVLSDFIYTYIIRKLAHNANAFVDMLNSGAEKKQKNSAKILDISVFGLIPRTYLFSVNAITKERRSDSDWISLLNTMHFSGALLDGGSEEIPDIFEQQIKFEICRYNDSNEIKINEEIISTDTKRQVWERIKKTFELVKSHKKRDFLKPWWKTVFEFNSFITFHFQDDNVRKKLCKWICFGGGYGLEAAEFRSQIAKHVIYITKILAILNKPGYILQNALDEGDFFVVERSNRFFSVEAIDKLNIALKANEIIDFSDKSVKRASNYFIKKLTSIIPQKDYSAVYAKEGFYIFSRKFLYDNHNIQKRDYELIEKIFVFVAKEFVNRGEQDFVKRFCTQESCKKNEIESEMDMCARFLES